MDLIVQVLGRTEPLLISHLRSSPLTRHLKFPDDIGSYVGVAIRMRGKPLGVLSIFGKTGHRFSNHDVCLISSIADHLAIAAEHKKLDGEAKALFEKIDLSFEEIKIEGTPRRLVVKGRSTPLSISHLGD